MSLRAELEVPKRFENPPLVELIAELRWLPSGATDGTSGAPPDVMPLGFPVPMSLFGGTGDDLYMSFAALAGKHGYSQIERLMPPGITFPYQPACRYRRPPDPQLYQLGLGIFSANTTPPYTSWIDFRPVVETGVELMLEAHHVEWRPKSFNSVALRYIDGFTAQFTRGMSLGRFVSDILGIRVELPTALTRQIGKDGEVKPQLILNIPIRDGLQMDLRIGEGKINGMDAVIMDTAVRAAQSINASVQETMKALDAAHTVIHETFVELSASLHSIMKPLQD